MGVMGGRATNKAQKRLIKAAVKVSKRRREGLDLQDEEYRAAVKGLLEAAVEWRESAVVKKNGERRTRKRPTFTEPPAIPDPDKPPKLATFLGNLTFWASRYAWDHEDGQGDVVEAANGLVKTAAAGYVKAEAVATEDTGTGEAAPAPTAETGG